MQTPSSSHKKRSFEESHRLRRYFAVRPLPGVILCLPLVVFLLSGCHVTPYYRTLPDWVGSVYVPMAANTTAEPGLEELITNAFTEELLADGRLDVVRKRKSNLVVKVTILEFQSHAGDFDVDDVESVREILLTLGLELFDPSDMENPVGGVPAGIVVPFRYASGTRSIGSLLRVDALDRLAEITARSLVHNLMTQITMAEE